MRPTFDPDEHVRDLEDGRPYLDLKWRLVWLRSREPDASIETQVVLTNEDEVVCRTSITLRSGASVTAHGSARRSESAQAVEDAENRSTMRALAALGYGAEYIDDDDVQISPTLEPPVNLMTARALLDRVEPAGQPPDQSPETDEGETADQPDDSSNATFEHPEPYDGDPSPSGASNESDLRPAQAAEDVSWTKFWAWAKPRGYGSAAELGELLDVDVIAHTPGEIRRMIKRYELEHPPGEVPGQ